MNQRTEQQPVDAVPEGAGDAAAKPAPPRSRTAGRRRVIALLLSDAARGARQYVASFRAGRGAE